HPSPEDGLRGRPRSAISPPATMSGPNPVPSHIAHNVSEGESLVFVPSRTPLSGNGPMPISDKVVDDPNQPSIPSNFQMMLDDREHIRAGGIVKPSVKGAVSTHPRSIAGYLDEIHEIYLLVD